MASTNHHRIANKQINSSRAMRQVGEVNLGPGMDIVILIKCEILSLLTNNPHRHIWVIKATFNNSDLFFLIAPPLLFMPQC